jgi:hypothetical protein
MPIIALIRVVAPREIMHVYQSIPGAVGIPGVGSVSPPTIGWRGGGEITYQDNGQGGQVAVEGSARFGIVEVTPGSVPSGHRILGTNYTLNQDDSVTQSFLTEAIPQPDPTDIELLIQDVADLKTRVTALEGAP